MNLLSQSDIIKVAEKLEIIPELLIAIDQTESAGVGFFLSPGKYQNFLKILCEGHIFSQYTGGKYDKSYPTISYPRWTKKFYLSGQNEYKRYELMMKLDKKAALLSCSYGRYQTMGFNFEKCGYDSVEEMINDYNLGEIQQLSGFLNFCENTVSKKYKKNLIEILQEYSKSSDEDYLKNFILHYNGSGQIEVYKDMILKHMNKAKENLNKK